LSAVPPSLRQHNLLLTSVLRLTPSVLPDINTCHEDDAMSVEQALAPTVYSWSPKPNTPPQRLSDSSGSQLTFIMMDVLKTVGEMVSRFGEMV